MSRHFLIIEDIKICIAAQRTFPVYNSRISVFRIQRWGLYATSCVWFWSFR